MEEKNSNRTRIIGLRLTPGEYQLIEKKWKASTCRKLSDYVRHCLFNLPLTVRSRDQSTQDLIAELTRLRTELNRIGNNFNQAVKRLHTLDKTDEFRQWLIAYELEKQTLFNKVEQVKNRIHKLAESWLQ